MKICYKILWAAITISTHQVTIAQSPCGGVRGPNVLGAKGTFSAPYITVNTAASACISQGSNSFNPVGNIGNALTGCVNPGVLIPCSDYIYTGESQGLTPAFTYSVLKTIGDINGGNCIKGDWRGKDHTGDGGYFMAVNGSPANTSSPLFYQIKRIPVCIGAIYEFSAWVINLLPSTSGNATLGSEPNISFRVNGDPIANSGPIPYTSTPTWVKVAGTFTATTEFVDLEVINATSVFIGNDLGLDDIAFNVCASRIAVSGTASSTICEGIDVNADFVVTDDNRRNTWYKWQTSIDGGITYTNTSAGEEATFTGNSYSLALHIGIVNQTMNGYKYRLVVSTSLAGLSNPDCISYNDYTLIVGPCGQLPVKLISFNGRYALGTAVLNWQTSQEMNSDRFELYRSNDGQDFIKVGSVPSAGNSNSVKNYSYTDNTSGIEGNYVFYQLKQIDIDGKATFSELVKLSIGSKAGFDIFPNPFSTGFTVSFGAARTSTASLKIRNNAGSLVYAATIKVSKGNNSVVLNSLPHLNPGVYYVTIYNEEMNFNGKLQKQ